MATGNGLKMLLPSSTRSLETMTVPITMALACVLAFLLLHILTPSVDPREPPLLKPRIPLIGHIIGIIRHQAAYHTKLHSASTRRPIATLPMLTGKMYAIWDPHLVAAALRSKSLSTTPTILEASPALSQLSEGATALLRSPRGPHIVDRIMLHAIPPSLKSTSLHRLNTTALTSLASALTTLSAPAPTPTKTLPNTWLWLRHLLTTATSQALYGPPTQNPFALTPALEPALFALEENLLLLTLPLPPILRIPAAGHAARDVLARALTPYYAARHDEDAAASEFVRNRAAELRAAGFAVGDIARLEMMLPFAALVNTVPTLFWLVGFVFSGLGGEGLVERLRDEVERGLLLVPGGGEGEERVVMVGAAVVEDKCPLLMACYRETLRMAVHQISTRTAMEDTVLRDGGGREYLLKKGNVVQMAIGVAHEMEEYWGEGVNEFRPERWLRPKGEGGDGPGSLKAMRAAFLPFGGGTHLCPGRQFAFAEMIAVMTTLLLGFEVEPLEGNEWTLPSFATPSLIDAVVKPANHGEGFGMRVRGRQGWEGVRWRYEL